MVQTLFEMPRLGLKLMHELLCHVVLIHTPEFWEIMDLWNHALW